MTNQSSGTGPAKLTDEGVEVEGVGEVPWEMLGELERRKP